MAYPLLSARHPVGTLRYYLPPLAWVVFAYCILCVLKGHASFTDSSNEHWELDARDDPWRFWWVVWTSTILGILFMLAVLAGEKHLGRSWF